MYRVIQTTRPDGKNLLRLLPISKTSVPIVQSPDMPNNSNTNVSSSVHLTFKTQLGNTAAPSSVKIPIFQPPDPGKIVLTRTLDKQESDRVGSEKESLIPSAAANAQSSSVPIDGVSLQNAAITSSSHQSSTTYMVVNTKSLPVTVKSPVPSGHHLQIPADAEVKSVPASLLPPAIQQKILAAAATNVSGGVDSTKTPTVIYVSPVNTVKTSQVLPKHLQSFHPKPATEVSKTLIVTAAQKGSDSSPEPFTSEGQQCQQTPMKWIVQEAAPLSAPCLIPVKSSNNVASKILKTLSCTKNVDVNPANILPLCSSGPGGSHTKITPLKDNALVMYNGKVYLLTKRGSDVLSAQADKQMSSFSDASLKKEAPKQIDSTEVNKITSEVVNLVLKSKGVVLSQKDPKPCAVSKNSSPIGLRNDLKSTPAALLTPSANQQDPTVIQRQSLPFTRSISCSGVIEVPAVGMQESVWQNGKDMSHSPRAAGTVLPQAKQECAVSEDWPKIQCEKMDSLGKVIQIKHHEHTHWRQYLELRKKFGLFKEERVYLRRIPLRVFCENPEERICSNDSVERKNDSCGSSSLDMEIMSHHQECVKEEKIIVDLEEDLMRKRKIRSSPLSDTVKRKRTLIKSATIPSSEMNSSRSSALNRSVSPLLDSPQPGVPTGSVGVSQGRDSEQDTFPWYSDTTHPGISVLVTSEEDTSVLEEPFQDDAFPVAPPDLDETIRDEKIKRLKQLLREREAALEEMRREMQQR